MPNNGRVLANHVQACMIDGPCKDILPLPEVVWRDGGFSVVRAAEEGEQVYDIGLVRYNAPEEEKEEAVVVVEETPAEEAPASEE
jgi:hypothetical protein